MPKFFFIAANYVIVKILYPIIKIFILNRQCQHMDTALKKEPDFSQAMRGKVLDVLAMAKLRVISAYCNDFIILLAL